MVSLDTRKFRQMKKYYAILLLIVLSCTNQQELVVTSTINKMDSNQILESVDTLQKQEICWVGTLDNTIPVFIHYQLDGHLVIGSITYLNTKKKLPIKLLGTIERDQQFRLLEFANDGNISGIITGVPKGSVFTGNWYSTQSNKTHSMTLTSADTFIISPNINAIDSLIFGSYSYQYGSHGYNGYFEIDKVDSSNVDFSILSLTNMERGPSIAEVTKDTILLNGTSFIYNIPDSDSCEFKATFYKDFVYVQYTKGYCAGQFGLNATIDGIFVKIK